MMSPDETQADDDRDQTVTADSVKAVRSYFSSKLPPELVTEILDLAQYWVSDITIREEPRVKTFSNANVRYLSTDPLLGGDFTHPLRQVVVTTVSKDQGWSNDASRFGGTYEASWTWFELSLENPQTGEEKYRMDVVRNVHAGKKFTEHVTYLNDPRLFELAEAGDVISVWVRASFPGWVNHVKSVSIETFVAY